VSQSIRLVEELFERGIEQCSTYIVDTLQLQLSARTGTLVQPASRSKNPGKIRSLNPTYRKNTQSNSPSGEVDGDGDGDEDEDDDGEQSMQCEVYSAQAVITLRPSLSCSEGS
jgi:hypothetical protein